mmetsp:Transcript_33573/g.75430  ORF Transcript_33573/g.75430 Transcript_33573/m.75430 type:complete len:355 (-) Transcript_33573:448-1512(-)
MAETNKDLPLPEGEGVKAIRKPEGVACSRCRKHKTKCSKTRPCSSCTRMGLGTDCDAVFGISTCWVCRRSKLKCDKQRPCDSCTRRGKAMECLAADETMSLLEDDDSLKVTSFHRIVSPGRPWPLKLELELETNSPQMLSNDKGQDVISQLILRTSQLGYDYTSILYMFNSMGEDLASALKELLTSLAIIRPNMFSTNPQWPSTLKMPGSEISRTTVPHYVSGSSSSSWTVYWKPNGFIRQSIKVGSGLAQVLHRNPEEILTRAARCEVEIPSSDVEFMCMILDDLLNSSNTALLRNQRICRRTSDGRLEESSLVKSSSFRNYDQQGQLVCSTHTVEILDAEEWDRIHNESKEM